MPLFHFTCDHGRRALGDGPAVLLPLRQWAPQVAARFDPDVACLAEIVWMTPAAAPDRAALGLTARYAVCDRTQFRYRVTDPAAARPYLECWAELVPRPVHLSLCRSAGARPGLWWVATDPVPVEYAPPAAAGRLLFVG